MMEVEISTTNELGSGANDVFQDTIREGGGGGEEQEAEEDEEVEDRPVLAVFYTGGKLGAATYEAGSAIFRILSDVEDLSPAFNVTKTLLAQTNPCAVVVSNRMNEDFGKVLRQALGKAEEGEKGEGGEEQETTTTRDSALLDVDLRELPAKEFGYRSGKNRVLSLQLQRGRTGQEEEDEEEERAERFVYINSLVDFHCESSIRAAGGLLGFLEKHPLGGPDLDAPPGQGGCLVLSLQNLFVESLVSVDPTTFTALHVFNSSLQPAASRSGSWNKTREGLSLFSLLNRCRSAEGAKYLRNLCRCPVSDVSVIRDRQDAVGFFAAPSRRELGATLYSLLARVRNVPVLLKRIASTQAAVRDWKYFKRSVASLLAIYELCRQHAVAAGVEIVSKVNAVAVDDVYTVADFMEKVLDMEASERRQRFTVKSGVDASLDERRRIHNGLPDLLLSMAQEEIGDLPSYIKECSMVYVPQIGYMLSIKPWADDLKEEDYQELNLQYMFSAERPYFKTERCRELDEMLGDTATSIAEYETAIMMKLTRYILSSAETLLSLAHYAAILDCLLALTAVAVENDWKRPLVRPREDCDTFNINAGRHPLLELTSNTVVPNSTRLGENEEKLMVLTGPNACGKSVYLKQVGLIAFLAHMGSWVPAESATMPVLDAIRTRIQTVDSLSLGLSAFAVDLNQMSLAVRTSTRASLVLVDEFGKGTTEVDGKALLSACVEHFLQRPPDRKPFVILTTHFHDLGAILGGGRGGEAIGARFCTFRHTFNEAGDLVFLYSLVAVAKRGTTSTTSSHALAVAKKAGMNERVVIRGAEVLDAIVQGREKHLRIRGDVYPFREMEALVEEFFRANLDDPQVVEDLMDKFRTK